MLEILLLIGLSRRLGAKVAAKGHNKFPYQLLLWVLWIGGEVAGAIIGTLISEYAMNGEDSSVMFIYLFAIVGAVVGAVIAHAIANALKPVENDPLRERDYPDDLDRRFGDPIDQRNDITDRPAPRRDDGPR